MSSVPYFQSKQILISDDTGKLNPHTWTSDGVWSGNVVQLFNEKISTKPTATILDIGAQSGAFSLLAKYHPNSKWFCFECDPTNYRLLTENIKLNNIDNCSTHQIAVSNKSGKAILRRSSHFGLHTLGQTPQRFQEDQSLNIEVDTISIDEFVETNNLSSVDFIKIDTEGCELNILKGAVKTIAKFKPEILFEAHGENLAQFNLTEKDLLSFVVNELSYVIKYWMGEDIYAVPK